MGIYVVRAFVQLRQVFDSLRELTTPPDAPKRPIGFVTQEDKKDKPKGIGKIIKTVEISRGNKAGDRASRAPQEENDYKPRSSSRFKKKLGSYFN